MRGWFAELDRLLRGEFTKPEELREGRVALPTRKLVFVCLVLGAVYGLAMGLFSALGGREGHWRFLPTSAIKVPLLFLLTLLVTLPSLYVFAALANSRLRLRETLRLLAATVAVNLGVLASFAPVTAFFTVSTQSHTFMIILNVLFFTLAGAVGLGFLNRAVGAVFADDAKEGERGRAAAVTRARRIFRIWLVIYGVVGAQMGWILRPFIGNPHLPFEYVRERWSNFFEFMARTLTNNW